MRKTSLMEVSPAIASQAVQARAIPVGRGPYLNRVVRKPKRFSASAGDQSRRCGRRGSQNGVVDAD
jgi:hypothetical protein